MKISQKTLRNFIVLSCIVLVLFLAGCFLKPAVAPPLPEQPTFTHYRVTTQSYKDSNLAHSIEIAWRANSIDYSFKLFKSINGAPLKELFDDGVEQSSYYQRKSCSCSFTDVQAQPGNQYSYYVLAYDEKGEIGQTETFSRNIFLPPCTLKEPQDNAEVDTPMPTFSWDNQELTKYLSKSKAEGYLKTHLKVDDETVQEEVWDMTMEDATVDNVTYNLDDTGEPLVNEHEYEWFHWTDAYDAGGNLIANAYSNSWHFHYKGPIKAVLMGKIMVPENASIIPLVDATITFTDSEGNIHTGTTQAQGQYVFPQVAPGTNYIITAVGEVDGQTVVYKDVVPSIALHEVFDAGIADAESTALALVMEAMLEADPSLNPEDIVLDDILNAENFISLVSTVDLVLNAYGDVTTDAEVADAVETVESELLFFADFEARSRIHRRRNGEIRHFVHLFWKPHPDATDEYNIYKQKDNGGYAIALLECEYNEESECYDAWEGGVSPEMVYEYYIEAITPGGPVTCPPEIVDVWLPATAPISPAMNSVVTNPTPTFQWQSLDISIPYQDRIYSGNVELFVTDETTGEDVWHVEINGLDVSSVTYGGPALQEGCEYTWFASFNGNDGPNLSGKEIAHSSCRSSFYYGYKPLELRGHTWVHKRTDNSIEYTVRLESDGYPDASIYHVYRYDGISEDITDFSEISGIFEFDPEDGSFEFQDENVTPGNPYCYYIKADLPTGGSSNPSPILVLDSWYSDFDLDYPGPHAILTSEDIPITFSWFPPTDIYPGSITQGDMRFTIVDLTIGEEIWDCWIEDDLTINSFVYDENGLIDGHEYRWKVHYDAEIETGEETANTTTEGIFYFGYQPLELLGHTWVQKPPDNSIKYAVLFHSDGYPDASVYHVYRYDGISEDITDFSEISVIFEFDPEDGSFGFWDENVTPGNPYCYYIVADLPAGGSSNPSRIVVLDSWYSDFDLDYPGPDAILTSEDMPITFSWFPPTDIYPGSITQGDMKTEIKDLTIEEIIWDCWIEDDLSITSFVYDENGLVDGHEYRWGVFYKSGIETGEATASTLTERTFYYGYKPWHYGCIASSDPVPGSIHAGINWEGFADANSYKILKGTDGTNFPDIFEDYEVDGNNYNFIDNDVIKGTTYYYEIEAYDISNNLIQTSDVLIINAWLPAMIADYPINNEIVMVNTITFSWHDETTFTFPYMGEYEFQDAHFILWDASTGELMWEDCWDNYTDKSITCENLPLIEGVQYEWKHYICGENDSDTKIVSSIHGRFYYGDKPLELNGHTWVHKHPDNSIEYAVLLDFDEYPDASIYHVYRYNGISEDITDFSEISGILEFDPEDGRFRFRDENVTPGNPYCYYIVADLSAGGSSNPSPIVVLDSWYSDFDLEYPGPDAILTSEDMPITFSWFPPTDIYPGSITQGNMDISIDDLTIGEEIWDYWIEDDLSINSVVYDENGLIDGHEYVWKVRYDGEIETGEHIASRTTVGIFYYGYQP